MDPKGSNDCGVLQWAGGGVNKHLLLKMWHIKTRPYTIWYVLEHSFCHFQAFLKPVPFEICFVETKLLHAKDF